MKIRKLELTWQMKLPKIPSKVLCVRTEKSRLQDTRTNSLFYASGMTGANVNDDDDLRIIRFSIGATHNIIKHKHKNELVLTENQKSS